MKKPNYELKKCDWCFDEIKPYSKTGRLIPRNEYSNRNACNKRECRAKQREKMRGKKDQHELIGQKTVVDYFFLGQLHIWRKTNPTTKQTGV